MQSKQEGDIRQVNTIHVACSCCYNRFMLVVAVANQKGGVGKTAVAANLTAVLARTARVLAVDLDPQAALSRQLVPGDHPLGIADVLGGDRSLQDVVVTSATTSADVVPSSRALAEVELGLVVAVRREERLARALAATDGYDLVIIDCPPNLGTLTVNALAAADEVVIPVSAEDEGAVRGVGELLLTLAEVYGDQAQPPVSAVLTKWLKGREAAAAVEEALPQMGIDVVDARIPSSAQHHKAPMWGTPVVVRKPDGKAGVAYYQLASDLNLRKVA